MINQFEYTSKAVLLLCEGILNVSITPIKNYNQHVFIVIHVGFSVLVKNFVRGGVKVKTNWTRIIVQSLY